MVYSTTSRLVLRRGGPRPNAWTVCCGQSFMVDIWGSSAIEGVVIAVVRKERRINVGLLC